MPVLPGAEPFAHAGNGEIGVLLCHGFTGSPQSMRPWGEHLAAAGFAVRCPLLPGHGTTWQECNRTGWQDWYRCVETELTRLVTECDTTFVFGLSMGGTLALRLAENNPDAVAGLALVNPSVTTLRHGVAMLPIISRFVPSLRGIGGDVAAVGDTEQAYNRLPLRAMASLAALWRVVRADLAEVRAPLLLFRSATDHVVEPVNAELVRSGVSSDDVREVVLPHSYHVATLDNDASTIFELSAEFATRLHGQRAEQVR